MFLTLSCYPCLCCLSVCLFVSLVVFIALSLTDLCTLPLLPPPSVRVPLLTWSLVDPGRVGRVGPVVHCAVRCRYSVDSKGPLVPQGQKAGGGRPGRGGGLALNGGAGEAFASPPRASDDASDMIGISLSPRTPLFKPSPMDTGSGSDGGSSGGGSSGGGGGGGLGNSGSPDQPRSIYYGLRIDEALELDSGESESEEVDDSRPVRRPRASGGAPTPAGAGVDVDDLPGERKGDGDDDGGGGGVGGGVAGGDRRMSRPHRPAGRAGGAAPGSGKTPAARPSPIPYRRGTRVDSANVARGGGAGAAVTPGGGGAVRTASSTPVLSSKVSGRACVPAGASTSAPRDSGFLLPHRWTSPQRLSS